MIAKAGRYIKSSDHFETSISIGSINSSCPRAMDGMRIVVGHAFVMGPQGPEVILEVQSVSHVLHTLADFHFRILRAIPFVGYAVPITPHISMFKSVQEEVRDDSGTILLSSVLRGTVRATGEIDIPDCKG